MLVSIAVLLLFGLVGGFAPLKVSQLSQTSVDIACAFAGGILAAVAVVHMLDDAGGELEESGKAFALALGGGDDAVFPMANTLFMVGVFAILSVEAILHHKVGGHAHGNSNDHYATQVHGHGYVRRSLSSLVCTMMWRRADAPWPRVFAGTTRMATASTTTTPPRSTATATGVTPRQGLRERQSCCQRAARARTRAATPLEAGPRLSASRFIQSSRVWPLGPYRPKIRLHWGLWFLRLLATRASPPSRLAQSICR